MNENVFIMEHPLIQHKISMLRDERTGTNEFRRLIEEITVLWIMRPFVICPLKI